MPDRTCLTSAPGLPAENRTSLRYVTKIPHLTAAYRFRSVTISSITRGFPGLRFDTPHHRERSMQNCHPAPESKGTHISWAF